MPTPAPFTPTYEQLIAFAVGELPASQIAAIEAYLKTDRKAAATVAMYRAASHAMASDDSLAAPEHVIDRARAIFQSRAVATYGAPSSIASTVAGWMAAADRLVGRLIFDSRMQPAAVRYADMHDRVNLTFESDWAEVDVQAERLPRDSAGPGEAAARWRIMGQISAPAQDAGLRELALLMRGTCSPTVTAIADEHGGFAFEAPAGAYDLVIRRGASALLLSPIELT